MLKSSMSLSEIHNAIKDDVGFIAKSFAETEWEKYRVIQDKIYKSDFDLFLEEAKKIK